MLAHKIEEGLRCNECGTRQEEWDENRHSYDVHTRRCVGCEKIAWEQHSWAEDKASAYGLKFSLVKANILPPARL